MKTPPNSSQNWCLVLVPVLRHTEKGPFHHRYETNASPRTSYEKSLARAKYIFSFLKKKLLLFLHKCTNSKSFFYTRTAHLYMSLYTTQCLQLMSMGELLIPFCNYENITRRYGRYLYEFWFSFSESSNWAEVYNRGEM